MIIRTTVDISFHDIHGNLLNRINKGSELEVTYEHPTYYVVKGGVGVYKDECVVIEDN